MSSSSSTSDNIGLSDINKNKVNDNSSSSSITSWREKITTSIAKSRKIRGGNFVQIATVDPTTLEPRCRTVVFRGFLTSDNSKDGTIMKMITDLRSSKVSEVKSNTNNDNENNSNNTAEMVWWFSKSSEQYRIRGKLEFIGQDHSDPLMIQARKQQWGNLSDSAREQFYWKEPGVPFETQNTVPVGGRGEEDGKVLPPPESFLLMLLHPTRVDYLRLGDNYRQVDTLDQSYDGDESNGNNEAEKWNCERVNP